MAGVSGRAFELAKSGNSLDPLLRSAPVEESVGVELGPGFPPLEFRLAAMRGFGRIGSCLHFRLLEKVAPSFMAIDGTLTIFESL